MSNRPFNPKRNLGLVELVVGLLIIAVGIGVTWYTHRQAVEAGGGTYAVMYGPIVGGLLLVVRGILHIFPDDLAPDTLHAAPAEKAPPLRIALEIGGGLTLVFAGALYAAGLYRDAVPLEPEGYALPSVSSRHLATYWLSTLAGLGLLGLGFGHAAASLRRFDFSAAFGYRTFVAWRYLLVFKTRVTTRAKAALVVGALYVIFLIVTGWYEIMHPVTALKLGAVAGAYLAVVMFWGILRHSKPSTIMFLAGIMIAIGAMVATYVIGEPKPGPFAATPDHVTPILQALSIVVLVGFALAGLALFFGTLRAFFTFFTTVPIGGVWIGTAALVCVLSVMSGFETDLRNKILGSNAHIQITREDGEFVDWREAKAKLDKIPGIVASTPYATSEVVIAANNNGMNVIIKGIDPATVGNVTNLIAALEDKEAMERLEPLIDEEGDRGAPLAPTPSGGVDPPPPDLPAGGEPIDFSSTDAPADDATDAGADLRPDDTQLGTADAGAPLPPELLDAITADRARGPADLDAPPPPALDPPPDDLPIAGGDPIDYTEPDVLGDPAIAVSDEPFEPTLSRRTQALPGILVGRELVKQTHLYNGQEVRVVSPLSDPSNPDATGTPIPFNRDYRVAGVFFTGMYEYDLKYVYVTLDSLQDFLDRGDAVDGIEVRIRDADDTGRYVPTDDGPGLIREALGAGYRIQDWRELNRSLFSALKLEKIAMFLVLGIVILVASFSIVGNLIMVVVEKQREIALLKTLGASDTGVTHVFAVQGLIIGLIGTVLGVATGLAGCWAGKKYGLPLNPDVYYIDRLPIHVDPESVLAAALAGVVISIAATLYPALLAARVRPAAGMRH